MVNEWMVDEAIDYLKAEVERHRRELSDTKQRGC